MLLCSKNEVCSKNESTIETKLLRFILLKSRLSETYSNKQKRKLITSLLHILYHRKSVTFLNDCTFSLTSTVQEVHVIFK